VVDAARLEVSVITSFLERTVLAKAFSSAALVAQMETLIAIHVVVTMGTEDVDIRAPDLTWSGPLTLPQVRAYLARLLGHHTMAANAGSLGIDPYIHPCD
jgi:hypothetical protein